MASIRTIGDLPYIYVVGPAGEVRQMPYSSGTSGRIIEVRNGRPFITPEAAEKGWVKLEDLYKQDSRTLIKAKGMANFLAHEAAAQRKQVKRGVTKRIDGTPRAFNEPLEDKYLPEEVIRRRDGTSDISTKVFEPMLLDDEPAPEPVAEEVTAEIEAPASKKRSKKSA